MNREREGLHINSYPEAENPRSFEETVPTIQASWHHGQQAVHCYWKHFQILFLAFCKYRCGFRKQKNKNLEPSTWSDSTKLILILCGGRWQIGFPTEVCPGVRVCGGGDCFRPVQWFASWFCSILFLRSRAGFWQQLLQFWPLRWMKGVWWASSRRVLARTATCSHIDKRSLV